MSGNPFAGTLPPSHNNSIMAGNPFDPMSASVPLPQQPKPASTPQQSFGQMDGAQKDASSRALGYPMGTAPQPPITPYSPYGMAHKQVLAGPMVGQQPAFGQPSSEPFQMYGQMTQQPGGYPQVGVGDNAMVVSAQQANPYTINPFFPGAIVPSQQQSSSWGLTSPSHPTTSFDPFAPAPPPPPPPPAQQFVQQAPPPQIQQEYRAAPPSQEIVPSQFPSPSQYHVQAPPPEPPKQQSPVPLEQKFDRYDPQSAPVPVTRDHGSVNRHDPEQNKTNPHDEDAPSHVIVERERKQAEIGRELQRVEAMPGASPLPKPELVRKKGFVLSRISFRTIVMKKWKQAYWVQYGPHTMLWFRSQTDFSDWLNNPYHNQAQRNFLIKLAVNFVHDLYKPSVRGYQVTQCRTKAYGNKMIRQFKLERWMDYGPTIAAAFGSYNPKEVDDLRVAIVECMRNTPLTNGIRATGAVRQTPTKSSDDADSESGEGDDRAKVHEGQENRQHALTNGASQPVATGVKKAADSDDLLDLDNWDDISVQQHSVVPYVTDHSVHMLPPGQYPPPHDQFGTQQGVLAAYGVPPPPHQMPPQQQLPFGTPTTPIPQQKVYGAPPQPYGAQSPMPQDSNNVYGVHVQQNVFGAAQQPFGASPPQPQDTSNIFGVPPQNNFQGVPQQPFGAIAPPVQDPSHAYGVPPQQNVYGEAPQLEASSQNNVYGSQQFGASVPQAHHTRTQSLNSVYGAQSQAFGASVHQVHDTRSQSLSSVYGAQPQPFGPSGPQIQDPNDVHATPQEDIYEPPVQLFGSSPLPVQDISNGFQFPPQDPKNVYGAPTQQNIYGMPPQQNSYGAPNPDPNIYGAPPSHNIYGEVPPQQNPFGSPQAF